MARPRLAVKVLVQNEGRVLVIHYRDDYGDWYSLPGGGVHEGESLEAGAYRECLEETGLQVRVNDIAYVRDFLSENHPERRQVFLPLHQVDVVFHATLDRDKSPSTPSEPDPGQVGVAWLSLDELEAARFYPKAAVAWLREASSRVYLGAVN